MMESTEAPVMKLCFLAAGEGTGAHECDGARLVVMQFRNIVDGEETGLIGLTLPELKRLHELSGKILQAENVISKEELRT